jgi:hypothetical protein
MAALQAVNVPACAKPLNATENLQFAPVRTGLAAASMGESRRIKLRKQEILQNLFCPNAAYTAPAQHVLGAAAGAVYFGLQNADGDTGKEQN